VSAPAVGVVGRAATHRLRGPSVAEGIEARLAAAEAAPEAIAAADREQLVELRGVDVNHAQERIDKIRDLAE